MIKRIDGPIIVKEENDSTKNLKEKDMLTGGNSAPLHSGAVKYYKEKGWM